MSDHQLTQEDSAGKYNEVWEVFMSNQKQPYIMNEMEYVVFSNALLQGIKGTISFDWGALNTSFFVSSLRKSRKLKPEYQPKQLEEPVYQDPTPEEQLKIQELIDEMRKKLNIKISKN